VKKIYDSSAVVQFCCGRTDGPKDVTDRAFSICTATAKELQKYVIVKRKET